MSKILCCFFLLLFWGESLVAQTVTRSIKDFGAKGDGKTNDHAAFEKAAAFFNNRKGNGKLIIPQGTYLVGAQEKKPVVNPSGVKDRHVLEFVNCRNLVIEGTNAVIRFRNGLRFGAFDPATLRPHHSKLPIFADYAYAYPIGSFLVLSNCSGITVQNIEIDGNQDGMILGGRYGDLGIQLTHDGVLVQNSTDVLLQNVYAHHFGRDGIMIANITPQQENTPNQKLRIISCRFEYNGRQGLSWIGGKGLFVSRSKFNHTGKGRFSSAPAAGIDIEGETGLLRDGVFEHCELTNNNGSGLVADNGNSRNMKFIDCTFWGTTGWSAWVTKPAYSFVNSRFYGAIVHGYNSPNDLDATRYLSCHFEDKPYGKQAAYGAYLAEINYVKRVRFESCIFVANRTKMIWVEGDPNWKEAEMPRFTNCTFDLKTVLKPLPEFWAKHFKVRFENCRWKLPVPASEGRLYVSGGENIVRGNNFIQYTDRDKKVE